jgi:hypothetical protein
MHGLAGEVERKSLISPSAAENNEIKNSTVACNQPVQKEDAVEEIIITNISYFQPRASEILYLLCSRFSLLLANCLLKSWYGVLFFQLNKLVCMAFSHNSRDSCFYHGQ